MCLMIDLPQPVEARLQAEAWKAGITVEELVRRTLAERFPADLDAYAEALQRIEQWISEPAADPENKAGARLLPPKME